LKWWVGRQSTSPAVVGPQVLAVQASSAASKRLFSVGGNTITKMRNRLSREMAADIIFLLETL
ncbi:unnamed protein product, partial [Laminaria digitata]